jgi:hypothetical protein
VGPVPHPRATLPRWIRSAPRRAARCGSGTRAGQGAATSRPTWSNAGAGSPASTPAAPRAPWSTRGLRHTIATSLICSAPGLMPRPSGRSDAASWHRSCRRARVSSMAHPSRRSLLSRAQQRAVGQTLLAQGPHNRPSLTSKNPRNGCQLPKSSARVRLWGGRAVQTSSIRFVLESFARSSGIRHTGPSGR